MSVDNAIDHIAEEYEGWGKKYKSSRPEWIARLQKWEKEHKKDRQAWTAQNHTKIQVWKGKYQQKKEEKEEKSEKKEEKVEAKKEEAKKGEKRTLGDAAAPATKKQKV